MSNFSKHLRELPLRPLAQIFRVILPPSSQYYFIVGWNEQYFTTLDSEDATVQPFGHFQTIVFVKFTGVKYLDIRTANETYRSSRQEI